MTFNFKWTDQSVKRNAVTEKHEPIQPFFFLEIVAAAHCEIVFDVGANVGLYSLISTLSPDIKKIHSFEPIDETYLELVQNVRENELHELIRTQNLAVSDVKKSIKFVVSDTPMSGIDAAKDAAFRNKKLLNQERQVKAVALDEMYQLSGKQLGLKVNMEGHEDAVIRGASKLLGNNNCAIQVTCQQDKKEAVQKQLGKLGYSQFFEIHNDLYFSNISQLLNKQKLVSLFQSCCNNIVANSLGRLPVIKSFIHLTATCSGDEIVARIDRVSPDFNAPLVYAFYLLVDGKKTKTVWYQAENEMRFEKPAHIPIGRLAITGFVREKANSTRQVMARTDVKEL